jgi:hypothetical protein
MVTDPLGVLRALEPKKHMAYVSEKAQELKVKYKREVRVRLIELAKRLPALVGRSRVPSNLNARSGLPRASKRPLGIYPDPTLGWGGHGTRVAEPRRA